MRFRGLPFGAAIVLLGCSTVAEPPGATRAGATSAASFTPPEGCVWERVGKTTSCTVRRDGRPTLLAVLHERVIEDGDLARDVAPGFDIMGEVFEEFAGVPTMQHIGTVVAASDLPKGADRCEAVKVLAKGRDGIFRAAQILSCGAARAEGGVRLVNLGALWLGREAEVGDGFERTDAIIRSLRM